jgi:hypothetical protein
MAYARPMTAGAAASTGLPSNSPQEPTAGFASLTRAVAQRQVR